MTERTNLKLDNDDRFYCQCPICGARADVYPDLTGDGVILKCEDRPGHDRRGVVDGIEVYLIT